MWPFSNYCKLCFVRDSTIFVAGAVTCMEANIIEAGVDNGFSTLNVISLALGSLFVFIMLYSAWINRNHVHKTS